MIVVVQDREAIAAQMLFAKISEQLVFETWESPSLLFTVTADDGTSCGAPSWAWDKQAGFRTSDGSDEPSAVFAVSQALLGAIVQQRLDDAEALVARGHFRRGGYAYDVHKFLTVANRMLGKEQPPSRTREPDPDQKQAIVDAARRKLRTRFSASALARIDEMLQGWLLRRPPVARLEQLGTAFVRGVGNAPWLDPDTLPHAALMKSAASELSLETRALVDGSVTVPQYPNAGLAAWKNWGGVVYGEVQEDKLAPFPATRALVEKMAERWPIVHAGFLVLDPGAELPLHVDGLSWLASVHLGISVPEACGIEVAGVARDHRNGEILAFNDSFFHRAWNRGKAPRLVLTVQSPLPELSRDEAEALVSIMTDLPAGTLTS